MIEQPIDLSDCLISESLAALVNAGELPPSVLELGDTTPVPYSKRPLQSKPERQDAACVPKKKKRKRGKWGQGLGLSFAGTKRRQHDGEDEHEDNDALEPGGDEDEI